MTRAPKVILLALCLFLPSLTACEEDVTAVRTERPFAAYGLFSPLYAKQEIYIFPVEERLRPLPPEPLDARVTTTDLVTGETIVWRDSIIAAADEGAAHLFWAPLRAAYDRAYLLEIERSDGARSTVEVAVPEAADFVIGEAYVDERGWPETPVMVDRPVPLLLHVEVVYDVRWGPRDSQRREFTLGYGAHSSEGGWTIDVNHHLDYRRLQNRVGSMFDPAYGLYVYDVRVRLLIASADWDPPGGAFDAEALAQPDVLRNVENGFGFVGAGYRRAVTWVPPVEVLVEAGFRGAP